MGGRCPPTWVASWGPLGLPGRFLGPLGASWGVLGASWGFLGASWGPPGGKVGLAVWVRDSESRFRVGIRGGDSESGIRGLRFAVSDRGLYHRRQGQTAFRTRGMGRGALGCSGVLWGAQGCSGVLWGRSGVLWGVLGRSGVLWEGGPRGGRPRSLNYSQ